jgi:hypothetical protein
MTLTGSCLKIVAHVLAAVNCRASVQSSTMEAPKKLPNLPSEKRIAVKNAHKFRTVEYAIPWNEHAIKSFIVDEKKSWLILYTSRSQGAYWNDDRFALFALDKGVIV